MEKAIVDALDKLSSCKSCQLMFDREDEKYGLRLLTRLRDDKVIIISENVPTDWIVGSSGKLVVKAYERLGTAGAETIDRLKSRSGEMPEPCIYINAANFMVTGEPAEDYGLYGLEHSEQRTLALLHELGHVARALQSDAAEPPSPQGHPKSAANTNCVRENCHTCKAFKPCPNVSDPHHVPTQRANQILRFYWLTLPFASGVFSLLLAVRKRRKAYTH